MLNNPSKDNWKVLQKVQPPQGSKEAVRRRVTESIKNEENRASNWWGFEWKHAILTGVFLLASITLLIQLQGGFLKEEKQHKQNAGFSKAGNPAAGVFSWNLETVKSKETDDGYAIYKDGSTVEAGYIKEVSKKEQEKMIATMPIGQQTYYENFPYPTSLYIEHVKMPNVVLRYHFFIEAGKRLFHFSIDYPKLDYTEIFQMVSTLVYSEQQPYIHGEPLYATHGYDDLPYPIGLRLTEDMGNIEKYIWEGASPKRFSEYLEKIRETGRTELEPGSRVKTFESFNGNQIVKITLDGKQLTYEFIYPNRED